MLTQVAYFAIARQDDGRVSRDYERLFTMALRWAPDYGRISEDVMQRGLGALRSLNDGQDVSEDRLNAARGYLALAIEHYETATWEPYPSRNAEAIADLRALLAELEV